MGSPSQLWRAALEPIITRSVSEGFRASPNAIRLTVSRRRTVEVGNTVLVDS